MDGFDGVLFIVFVVWFDFWLVVGWVLVVVLCLCVIVVY